MLLPKKWVPPYVRSGKSWQTGVTQKIRCGLKIMAVDNPKSFASILGRVLPMHVVISQRQDYYTDEEAFARMLRLHETGSTSVFSSRPCLADRAIDTHVRHPPRPLREMRLQCVEALEALPRDRVLLHVADAALVLPLVRARYGAQARTEAPCCANA